MSSRLPEVYEKVPHRFYRQHIFSVYLPVSYIDVYKARFALFAFFLPRSIYPKIVVAEISGDRFRKRSFSYRPMFLSLPPSFEPTTNSREEKDRPTNLLFHLTAVVNFVFVVLSTLCHLFSDFGVTTTTVIVCSLLCSLSLTLLFSRFGLAPAPPPSTSPIVLSLAPLFSSSSFDSLLFCFCCCSLQLQLLVSNYCVYTLLLHWYTLEYSTAAVSLSSGVALVRTKSGLSLSNQFIPHLVLSSIGGNNSSCFIIQIYYFKCCAAQC